MSQLVLDEIKRIEAILSTPAARAELRSLENIQRASESLIISDGSINNGRTCPISHLSKMSTLLFNLKPQEFKTLLNDNFYNPDVMAAVMCTANAIYYLPPSDRGSLSKSQRIRHWIINLHQIGAESAEGYAMRGDLDGVKDSFIVKVPRSASDGLMHEYFIGVYGLNALRAIVPNFAYIMGGFKCAPPYINNKNVDSFCENDRDPSKNVNYVLYENISPAISFGTYISQKSTSFVMFLEKYMQVLYALHIAVRDSDFTHYDLHIENILIRNISHGPANSDDTKVEGVNQFFIPYQTERGQEYLLTDGISTVIDYGQSHIKYNGQDYGYFRNISYNTYPNRSFPMFDAYKLLLFSMRTMRENGNIESYKGCELLLRFFNSTEPIDEIVDKQRATYYVLPIVAQNATASIFDYTTYIRSVYPTPFLVTDPSNIRVLGCMGTDICLSFEETVKRIGLDQEYSVPTTFFDFYDLYTRYNNDLSNVHHNKAVQLMQQFDHKAAENEHLAHYNSIIVNIVKRMEGFKVIQLSQHDIQTILRPEFLMLYKRYIGDVLAIYDMSQDLKLYHDIYIFITNLYGEKEAGNILDQNYNNVRTIFENELNFAIQSIRQDRQRLSGVISNPQYRDIINRALSNNQDVGWYWDGFNVFDAIIG